MFVTINSPTNDQNTMRWAVARSLFSEHSENLSCFNMVGKIRGIALMNPISSNSFFSVLPSKTAFSWISLINRFNPKAKITTTQIANGTKIISTSHVEKNRWCAIPCSPKGGEKSSNPVTRPRTIKMTAGIPMRMGSFLGSLTAFPTDLGTA